MNLQEMKFLRFFPFAIAVVSGIPLEDTRVECKHKFNVELKNVFLRNYKDSDQIRSCRDRWMYCCQNCSKRLWNRDVLEHWSNVRKWRTIFRKQRIYTKMLHCQGFHHHLQRFFRKEWTDSSGRSLCTILFENDIVCNLQITRV